LLVQGIELQFVCWTGRSPVRARTTLSRILKHWEVLP